MLEIDQKGKHKKGSLEMRKETAILDVHLQTYAFMYVYTHKYMYSPTQQTLNARSLHFTVEYSQGFTCLTIASSCCNQFLPSITALHH